MGKALAWAATGLLGCGVAGAADLTVLPVGLNLSAGQDRAAITVTNRGDEAVVMQVDPVAWTQSDDGDHYVPTGDLVVNPPVFVIAPRRAQVLRVGLRRPPAGEREVAYRLLLREVPSPGAAAGTDAGRVRVLLQLRLPVYVAPAKAVRSQQWRATRMADGAVAVDVTNDGTVHLVVNELTLRAGTDAPVAARRTSVAVFPGVTRRWDLRPDGPLPQAPLTLQASTDQGPRHVVLEPARP